MSESKELRVALLTADLSSCQSLASAFRLYRIFPFFYQTLADLWPLLKSSDIDLLVIEITKLQEGSLILSDHPTIQAQQLPVAIYFKPEHQGLLSLAHNLTTIGHLNGSMSLAHQIKGLVYFMGQWSSEKDRAQRLSLELEQQRRALELAQRAEESSRENLLKMIQVAQVIQKFQKKRAIGKENFLDLLSGFFESWSLIEKFSFVTLNGSYQKIFSPRLSQFKYVTLSAINVTHPLAEGIDGLHREVFLAQAYDHFGIDVIVLDIHASGLYPEVMIFLQVGQEQLRKTEDSYHWLVLENILSNLFKSALLQEQHMSSKEEGQISPLAALTQLDLMAEPEQDGGQRPLSIDARVLENWLLQSGYSFRWKDFDRDFIAELTLQLKGTCQWAYMSPWQWIFFLPPVLFDVNYQRIQQWVREFDYASYVDHPAVLWKKSYQPVISLVAADGRHFLKKRQLAQDLSSHAISQ